MGQKLAVAHVGGDLRQHVAMAKHRHYLFGKPFHAFAGVSADGGGDRVQAFQPGQNHTVGNPVALIEHQNRRFLSGPDFFQNHIHRLDLLGEEEFEYKLKPLLEEEGVRHLKALQATGVDVVLVSQGLEQVMRPLARHLGVRWIIANRLDFRNGIATGRLMSPVIRPRGLFARIREAGPDGTQSPARWVRALGLRGPKALASAIVPAVRMSAGLKVEFSAVMLPPSPITGSS